MNGKVLKGVGMRCNVVLVIGMMCLIMVKVMLGIGFFVVWLRISVVIFNVMLREGRGMKIGINVWLFIVMIGIVIVYFVLC